MCTCAVASAAQLRLESGVGLDTNVARVETLSASPVSDSVWLAVLDLSDAFRPRRSVRFDASYQLGAKRFAERSGEDAILQKLSGRVSWAAAGWLTAGVRLRAEDRTTRNPAQPLDRTRLVARPEVQARFAGLVAAVAAVAERHIFKPNSKLDSDGYGGDLSLTRRVGAFSASVTGSGRQRGFLGPPCELTEPEAGRSECADVGDAGRRRDEAWYGRLSLRYAGTWLARIGYTRGTNRSNFDAGNYALQALEANLTAPLPFELLVSARLYLLSIDHDHGVNVADRENRAVSFDSDARPSLTLRLERPLDERWSVVLKASTWSLPASGPDYRREMLAAGLAWSP